MDGGRGPGPAASKQALHARKQLNPRGISAASGRSSSAEESHQERKQAHQQFGGATSVDDDATHLLWQQWHSGWGLGAKKQKEDRQGAQHEAQGGQQQPPIWAAHLGSGAVEESSRHSPAAAAAAGEQAARQGGIVVVPQAGCRRARGAAGGSLGHAAAGRCNTSGRNSCCWRQQSLDGDWQEKEKNK